MSKGVDIGIGLGTGIVRIALLAAGLWVYLERKRNPRGKDHMETTRYHEETPSARLESEPKGEARFGLRYPDSPTEAARGRTFNELYNASNVI